MSSPGGRLQAQMLEPTRITQVLKPVSIHQTKPGTYLVDFGQNFYGQVRLRASAPAGTVVKMREAYSLNPDGSLRSQDNRSALATDIYIFKGVGVETWSPRFRGQGFRRVEVTGLPGKVTADQFAGLVVENDLDPVGSFECSIPLLNQIYRNVRWGERMFLRNGVPLDPDRDERQPWVGDPSKDSEGEAFNFNVAAFYDKWINDIFLDQQPDGKQSDVSPAYWAFYSGDIAWPSVLTIIPDWYYSFYGDRRILEVNYEPMKKWVEFCAHQLKPDYTVDKTNYGDWCDTASMDGKGGDEGATSHPLIGTAYCYLNVKLMARAAQRLGKTEDEKHYTDLAARIRDGFNQRLFNPQTAQYESATQASYVLPLAFGLVPEESRPRVIQNLVDDIMVQHHGYTTVGLLGMQWLMEVLTETGHADVALTIATRTKRPSWGYMIAKGATTIWERYDMDTRDPGMNSEALLIQTGDVEAWFYQGLAGINYDPEHPGFKNIVMHPRVVPGSDLCQGLARFAAGQDRQQLAGPRKGSFTGTLWCRPTPRPRSMCRRKTPNPCAKAANPRAMRMGSSSCAWKTMRRCTRSAPEATFSRAHCPRGNWECRIGGGRGDRIQSALPTPVQNAWRSILGLVFCHGSQDFLGRRRACSFFHDRNRGHDIAEAGGLHRVVRNRHGQCRSRGKAIAGAADVHGFIDWPRFGPGFFAFFEHQRALGALRQEKRLGPQRFSQALEIDGVEQRFAGGLRFAVVRLDHHVAEQVDAPAGIHQEDLFRILRGQGDERLAHGRRYHSALLRSLPGRPPARHQNLQWRRKGSTEFSVPLPRGAAWC